MKMSKDDIVKPKRKRTPNKPKVTAAVVTPVEKPKRKRTPNKPKDPVVVAPVAAPKAKRTRTPNKPKVEVQASATETVVKPKRTRTPNKPKDPNAPPRLRKKRKPMTDEQKLAAAENLQRARDARAAANPPTYKNIHPDVLALSDDDTFCRANIMEWIKHQKEVLVITRQEMRLNAKGAEARNASCAAYIRGLENYLKSGTYGDMMFGPNRDQPVKFTCITPAFYPDGTQKKSFGVFYPNDPDWTGTVKMVEGPTSKLRSGKGSPSLKRRTKKKV
jgi:hypothetical protein